MDRNEIMSQISSMPIPDVGKLSTKNLVSNLYVSVSSENSLGVFLDNVPDDPDPPNFENIQFFSKGRYSLKTLPSGDERLLSNCVRIEIKDAADPKIVSSIIELLIEESSQPYSFSDLLLAIEKFRELFKIPNNKLTDAELKGLWGELWLLKELIFRCSSKGEIEHCLDSWKGSDIAKRDFRFPKSKYVFEIKTTEKRTREHEISSADQLSLKPGEQGGYLVSIGVKREEGGASITIEKLTEIICRRLDDALLEKKLLNLLNERKWNLSNRQDISLIISTGIPMNLFLFEDIPSILPLPNGVTDATWVVNLGDANKISDTNQETIFDKALSVP